MNITIQRRTIRFNPEQDQPEVLYYKFKKPRYPRKLKKQIKKRLPRWTPKMAIGYVSQDIMDTMKKFNDLYDQTQAKMHNLIGVSKERLNHFEVIPTRLTKEGLFYSGIDPYDGNSQSFGSLPTGSCTKMTEDEFKKRYPDIEK